MKKQPEVTERTKAILMDEFWQLYCKTDIRNITVKSITSAAGYNRSTFYQYFTDVHEVLNELEDSLVAYLVSHIQNSIVSETSNNLIEQIAEMYDLKCEYISVLLGKNGDPLFAEKFKKSLRPIVIHQVGTKAQEANFDFLFEFAISGILSVITKWYEEGKPIPAKEIIIILRSMLYKGVYPFIS